MLDKYVALGRIPDDVEELCEAISSGKRVGFLDYKGYDYTVFRMITPEGFDSMQAAVGVYGIDPWEFMINPSILRNNQKQLIPKGTYEFRTFSHLGESAVCNLEDEE